MLKLVLVTIVVHAILFISIFDIYFRSPIEDGLTPEEHSYKPPPAKRLVLFVADGLRADTFYSVGREGRVLAPYLRNIIETKGNYRIPRPLVCKILDLTVLLYEYNTYVSICTMGQDLYRASMMIPCMSIYVHNNYTMTEYVYHVHIQCVL